MQFVTLEMQENARLPLTLTHWAGKRLVVFPVCTRNREASLRLLPADLLPQFSHIIEDIKNYHLTVAVLWLTK
jgi:hypothetical protein